jgi:uncharacterized membrane protein
MSDAGSAKVSAASKAPSWLMAALFASLAINLVVGGSLVGAVWRAHAPPPGALAIIPNLLGYASTLSPQRRTELWDRTAEERGHIRPFRREVRAAREETVKALVAEPFEREKFIAAQARQATAENRARDAAQELYVKIADFLTPEERRGYPRWREHRRPPSHNLLDEPDQQAGEPVRR